MFGDESSGDELVGLRLFRRKRKKGAPPATNPIVQNRLAKQGVIVKTQGYSKGRSQSLGFEFLAIQSGATVDVPASATHVSASGSPVMKNVPGMP